MNIYGVGERPRAFARISGGFRRSVMAVLAVAAFGAVPFVQGQTRATVDKDSFLKAVALVESNNNPRAVGRLGERGLFQFRKETWKQYTRRSFYKAHDRQTAYEIASKHYDWLYKRFVANGYRPTPYLMAAAWNAGLSKTLSGRMPASTRSYARRVASLAADFAAQAARYEVQPKRYFVATSE